MGNIGSGNGTSYPTALDTQTSPEVDSPAAGKTLARAAVPNDLAAAVLAIETALGLQPQGNLATVVAFLQKEHGVDGTHQHQLTMAAGSAAAPQIKSSSDATGLFFPANVLGFSVAGVEVGRLSSGDKLVGSTYAATISSRINCSGGTAAGVAYQQIGKVVSIFGVVSSLTVTSSGVATSLLLSLPSSTLSSGSGQAYCQSDTTAHSASSIAQVGAGNLIEIGPWTPPNNGTHNLYFSFMGVLN